MHRVNLERFPIIDTQRTVNLDWVRLHVSLALSNRERDLREQAKAMSVLTQIKDSLHCLFLRASEPNARRVFALAAPSLNIYTIIFLNQFCLDLASNTLVADTCILPLTLPRVETLGRYFADLQSDGKMIAINTSDEEARGWKQLIPVFVERCRTWGHLQTCQYKQVGTIPLSVELDQNPICGCGEGKGLDVFPSVPGWEKLAPYVTRAAFSPLFAAPFLEIVGGPLEDIDRKAVGAVCTYCKKAGKEGKLLKCGRCKVTDYCGHACQRTDWKQHKITCQTTS
jgi:hypothetical protein